MKKEASKIENLEPVATETTPVALIPEPPEAIDIETIENSSPLNVFELLANYQREHCNNVQCKIATLKDKCKPVEHGSLNVFSAKNGSIGDLDDNEIAKTIVVDVLAWYYVYLFTNGEHGVVARSYDNKSIDQTGETISSFLASNPDVDQKVYTQFIAIYQNQPVVISVSQYGTFKWRQHLASLMMSGSQSHKIEVSAINERGKTKTFTFLNVKVLDNAGEAK